MSVLVRHAMTRDPKSISPDMNAQDAAGLMKSEDVGALPIMQGDSLVGVVTDRDLVLRVLAERKDASQVRVGDIATRTPITVSPDNRVSEAREMMEQHRIRRLPVMKGESLVGILSLGDVAWAEASVREIGQALRSISESERTTEMNEDVPRGTPLRVQTHRGT